MADIDGSEAAPDPAVGRFLDMLASSGPAADLPTPARRRAFEALSRFARAPADTLRVTDHTAGGRALRHYAPPVAGPLPGLLFCHGGGLVSGGIDTHDALCRTLASAGICHVLAVDYRLAPEHVFPAAIDDCLMAWDWLRAHAEALDIDPRRIGIGGDSAGGTLAALAAQSLRGTEAAPAFQALLCPILDFAATTPSRRAFQSPLLDQATMDRDLASFAPGLDPADSRLSPLRAGDFTGLPRTTIHTASCDPLRDEGRAYAAALSAAGVPAAHAAHAGMIHLFYLLTGPVPRARVIVATIAADIGALARR